MINNVLHGLHLNGLTMNGRSKLRRATIEALKQPTLPIQVFEGGLVDVRTARGVVGHALRFSPRRTRSTF